MTLLVHADRSESTPVETWLRVDAPLTLHAARALLEPREMRDQHERLVRLFSSLGVLPNGMLASLVSFGADRPPIIRVSNARVHIWLAGSRDLASYLQFPAPDLWSIGRDRGLIRFCFGWARPVPQLATWFVDVYVAGALVQTVTPPPYDQRQVVDFPELGQERLPREAPLGEGGVSHIEWRLTGRPHEALGAACENSLDNNRAVERLELNLNATRRTRILVASYVGLGASVRLTLTYIAATALFIPLLVLLMSRRTRASLDSGTKRRVFLTMVGWLSLLAGSVTAWLIRPYAMDVDPIQATPFLFGGMIAFAAACVWDANNRLRAFVGVLVATAAANGAVVAELAGGRDVYFANNWSQLAEAGYAAFAAASLALASIAAFTYLLVRAAAGERWLPSPRVLAGAVLILAAALVVQNAAAGYEDWHTRRRAAVALNPGLIPKDWRGWVTGQLIFSPLQFANLVLNLLPLVGAALVLAVLVALARSADGPFFAETVAKGLVILVFAGVVVGTQDTVYGWPVPLPFLVSIPLLAVVAQRNRLQAAEAKVQEENPKWRQSFIDVREELLRRAVALSVIARKKTEIDRGAADASMKDDSTVAALDREARRLQSGRGRKPAGHTPATLRLPDGLSPGPLALGPGPGATWWDRGKTGIRVGAAAAAIPVAFFLYVLISRRLGSDLSLSNGFGVADLARSIVREVLFWLGAAFTLAMLFPYLPGSRGAVKGLSLAAVYATAGVIVASTSVFAGSRGDWFFRTFELALFLVAIGVLLDWQTLRENRIHWRYLGAYYRVADLYFASAYVSTAVTALIVILQQLHTGHAQGAVTEFVKSFSALIPPTR
jgi:hypothetical protein